jgi:hypothetical protein
MANDERRASRWIEQALSDPGSVFPALMRLRIVLI